MRFVPENPQLHGIFFMAWPPREAMVKWSERVEIHGKSWRKRRKAGGKAGDEWCGVSTSWVMRPF